MPTDTATIEKRLTALEGQNQRLKSLMIVALALGALPYLLAAGVPAKSSPSGKNARPTTPIPAKAAIPKVIRAEQFELVSGERTVASLRAETRGEQVGLGIYGNDEALIAFVTDDPVPQLEIHSQTATEKDYKVVLRASEINLLKGMQAIATVTYNALGGYLGIRNNEGKVVAWSQAQSTGGELGLNNAEGKASARLLASEAGGFMRVFNKAEKAIGYMGATTSGAGTLQVHNADGNMVSLLHGGPEGGFMRLLKNTGEGEVAYLGADRSGAGLLQIHSQQGTKLASLHSGTEGGTLQINNKQGNPVAWLFAQSNGGDMQILSNDSKYVGGIQCDARGGFFQVLKRDGKPTASFFTADDGNGTCSVFNNEGRPVVSLGGRTQNAGYVGVTNRYGTTVGELRGDSDVEGGHVVIYNRAGKVAVGCYTNQYGGNIGVSNNDDKVLSVIGAYTDGGRIRLLDPTGQTVRFSAP